MKTRFALGCCVACFAASTVSAGIAVSVIENPSPGTGFRSFNVRLIGTDGALINGVNDLTLTGAHQVWQHAFGFDDPSTPRLGDAEQSPFGKPEWTPFDTCVLPLPGGTVSPGFRIPETNDLSNPGGIDLSLPDPFGGFPGSAGIGDLTFTGHSPSYIAFFNPLPAQVDFMQVVIYGNDAAYLTMDLVDSNASLTPVRDLQIGGIPEPSTFALTGLALLGLLAASRRM